MRKIVPGIALALLAISPVSAAIKAPVLPVVLTTLNPTISTNFSGGDQVSQLLTSPVGFFLLGTVESTTSPLVATAPLGGSDGFITALNPQGAKLWDLRLGTAGDDVATAGYVDSLGDIWVTGSSAVPITGSTSAPALNRLTIWEVNSTGILLNTFSKDLANVDIPTSIAFKGANYIIQGLSSVISQPTFTVSLTPLGKIGTVKNSSIAPVKPAKFSSAKSSAYGWLSFVTRTAIKGVIGIPLHQVTPVLTKRSLKDKSLKGIYSVQGVPLSLQYQVGLGVVLLSQGAGNYFVTLIHTK
jgi:hypothetical protein